MTKQDYLKLLVETIHSTTIATIGADGHPQTRVIDMMLYDNQGVYFLTAKGKAFYAQLMEQGYIALSATREKVSISLRGKIKNIGSEKLDDIVRDSFTIGKVAQEAPGYYVGESCIGCKLCYSVCPQKCIDITKKPVVIDQHHCLHCGRCAEVCPKQTIEKRV